MTIRWKTGPTSEQVQEMVTAVTGSLEELFGQINGLQPYSTDGAQKACTTVNWPPDIADKKFWTDKQVHSEMSALHDMIEDTAPWYVRGTDGAIVAYNKQDIVETNYSTDLPHCGYCTIMLTILGLPMGTPTQGRYNLAVNLEYPVPQKIKDCATTLARLLYAQDIQHGLVRMKKIINSLINTPSSQAWVLQVGDEYITNDTVAQVRPDNVEVLTWEDAKDHHIDVNVTYYGNITVRDFLWKLVFQGIYNNTQ